MKIASDSMRKSRKDNGFGNSKATMGGVDSADLTGYPQEEMIAVAAYFRAEQRGFAPGDELADWFQAEAELQERAPRNAD